MENPAIEALEVIAELLQDRREQLLHDVWNLRSLFASSDGPWRRAGFASRTLVRAAVAEMDRREGVGADPVEAAFWILSAQRLLLNHDVVDERLTRTLFDAAEQLRPSQRQAAFRVLAARSANLQHPRGGPASNLLLITAVAGGLEWVSELTSYQAAAQLRFPGEAPQRRSAEAGVLLLDTERRHLLDERAHAIDLAHRLRGRAP
jgi:hypothetical protein